MVRSRKKPAGVYLQWKQKGNRAVTQVRQSTVLQSCGVTDPTAVQLHPLSTLTLSLFPAMPPPPPSSHLLSLPFLLYKPKVQSKCAVCVARTDGHIHTPLAVAPLTQLVTTAVSWAWSHQRKTRRSKFYLVWKTVCVDTSINQAKHAYTWRANVNCWLFSDCGPNQSWIRLVLTKGSSNRKGEPSCRCAKSKSISLPESGSN